MILVLQLGHWGEVAWPETPKNDSPTSQDRSGHYGLTADLSSGKCCSLLAECKYGSCCVRG